MNSSLTNNYSGVLLQLKEIYGVMKSSIKYEHMRGGIVDKTDAILEKIETDMLIKLKSVQSATALKVLKKFYKNITSCDQYTQMHEDPVLVEKHRLEEVIKSMKEERDKIFTDFASVHSQLESSNKARSLLNVQLRESK